MLEETADQKVRAAPSSVGLSRKLLGEEDFNLGKFSEVDGSCYSEPWGGEHCMLTAKCVPRPGGVQCIGDQRTRECQHV